MAFVILRPGARKQWVAGSDAEGKDANGKQQPSAFEHELKAYAKGRLPGFACPEWVEVVDELPVSMPMGQRSKHCTEKLTQTVENLDWQDTEARAAEGCREVVNGKQPGGESDLATLYIRGQAMYFRSSKSLKEPVRI